KLSPAIIRKRLDYWTLILGPKFSAKERKQLHLSRFYAIAQIEYCRKLHLQAQLSHPQAVRTQLRIRPVAADRRQDRRDLWHAPEPHDARQAGHRHRPHRARPSRLPRLLQTRLSEAVRKVRHLPAQRAGLQQPRRFPSQEGIGPSRCR